MENKQNQKGKIHKPWNRFHIMATRFNRDTWRENVEYCNRKRIKGALYGTRVRISNTIPPADYLFVFEMLNIPKGQPGYPGKIMGIGLVKNRIETKKRYTIYSDTNYNRYIYRSKYRVDRDSMTEKQLKMIEYIESIVFYGYTHIKRGVGITRVPQSLLGTKKRKVKRYLCKLFRDSIFC